MAAVTARTKLSKILIESGMFDEIEIAARIKGIDEGLEKGIEKGIEIEKLKTAKKLLKLGLEPELIAQYTDLDVNKINDIMG